MQIAHVLQQRALIAVLSLAAIVHSISERSRPRHHHHSRNTSGHYLGMDWYVTYDHNAPLAHAGELLSVRGNQHLLRNESAHRSAMECCPSVLEMIEPSGGRNPDDEFVELYQDGNTTQRFYEVSCHKDILERPCRFVDRKLQAESRCKQSFSYTYAMVKDRKQPHHRAQRWSLDYIQIRSGCSCVIVPASVAKKSAKSKQRDKAKNKRRHKGGPSAPDGD